MDERIGVPSFFKSTFCLHTLLDLPCDRPFEFGTDTSTNLIAENFSWPALGL
jgi:hypothetical protein